MLPHLTGGPPLPCKQALNSCHSSQAHQVNEILCGTVWQITLLARFLLPYFHTNENNGLCHTKWLKVKYYEEKKKQGDPRHMVEPRKTKGQGLEKFARCNKVSSYRGSFPYILLSLGLKNCSLYRWLRYMEVSYIEVCTVFYLVRIETRFVYLSISPFPPYCSRKIGLLKIKMAGSFIIRGPAHSSSRCRFFT